MSHPNSHYKTWSGSERIFCDTFCTQHLIPFAYSNVFLFLLELSLWGRRQHLSHPIFSGPAGAVFSEGRPGPVCKGGGRRAAMLKASKRLEEMGQEWGARGWAGVARPSLESVSFLDLYRVLGSDNTQVLQGGSKVKLTCTLCCI